MNNPMTEVNVEIINELSIIESYRKGKIYVYKSELGKGATFRIELKN